MHIIVCIKQVPGTAQVEIDEKTGVLKRDGVASKMNPFDLFAIESAMRLKTLYGGTVSVLTMGPPQAEKVVREAFMMGADHGYILSDRKFGGADVLATSYTLAQGIRKIGSFDLILCGKQTTDGDTAQVGAELAEFLSIPHITGVTKFLNFIDGKQLDLEADIPLYSLSVRIQLPCLVTVEKGIFEPRLPSFRKKLATADRPVTYFSLKDLEDTDETHYGLNGSPTQVKRIFPPEKISVNEHWEGSGDELAERLHSLLRDKKFLCEVR
ncbi:MAG: Acryloyl-CoA reductase electron transfer subunit gamma [Lentisphaerae bacterium ADurb.Bin242]|nr:MAG: Acryloyl-CoA reductase electron transfer subunit gamma [Lentisphaerae bacterium ADurb.Bin242]